MTQPALSTQAGPDYSRLEERLLDRMEGWQRDPERYVGEVFGMTPTWQQSKVYQALGRGDKRIAVRSGHGIGKSSIGATSCWHRLTCFGGKDPETHPRVPITAPTKHQLEDILWAEIGLWHGKMEPWLRHQFRVRSERVHHVRHKETWYAVGRTGRKENPDALQGFHGNNLLFIGDEASGIPEKLFEPVTGALTRPGNQLLLTGNPLWLLGYFYKAFHKDRAKWTSFTFNSEDSPLVDPEWCKDMADTYGAESDIYRIRVLGLHPKAAVGQLIRLDVAEAAMRRDYSEEHWAYAAKVLGVDVARHGDDSSVIIKRQGLRAYDMEKYKGDRALDSMALAGRISIIAKEWNPQAIFIDAVGMGVGVVDRLNQLGWGDIVIPVVGNDAANEDKKYYNLRSEMWCNLRDWLDQGGAIPNDDELRDDLVGPMYQFDLMKGRLQLERKRDMKKRGLASPDCADALAHTFVYQVAPTSQEEGIIRAMKEAQGRNPDMADTEYDPMEF